MVVKCIAKEKWHKSVDTSLPIRTLVPFYRQASPLTPISPNPASRELDIRQDKQQTTNATSHSNSTLSKLYP